MTEEIELLIHAVERLKYINYEDDHLTNDLIQTIQTFSEDKLVMAKPVAWQFRTFHGKDTVCPGWDVWEYCTELKFNNVSEYVNKGFYQVRKLYTTQAQAKREPLSDEEITKNTPKLIHIGERLAFHAGVRFSEKAHGIMEKRDV